MAHDVVLVTSIIPGDRDPDMDAFRASLPEEWRPLVVGPVRSITNGYGFYAFLPDGSKEGWDTSDKGDEYREQFVALFASGYFDVARVTYGGDDWDSPVATVQVIRPESREED
jgi:hypothetical protein